MLNKYQFILILAFIIFPILTFAQQFEKVVFDKNDSSNYYLAIKPKSGVIKGVLVLFPGFGADAESIFPETKLQNVAYANDILTIGFNNGRKIGVDDTVSNKINLVLKHVTDQFHVDTSKFVIGGFSSGGTIALRFTEFTREKPEKFYVKPKAVFAIDSPVDIFSMMEDDEREISKNFSDIGVNEAKYITSLMNNYYGKFRENKDVYNYLSPFYKDNKGQGNEKYLTKVPTRVYHDVDIEWQLKNRRRSIYDMNCLNSSEMINRLLLMGNAEAEFINSKNPGVRSDGTRHPHSWSIVDEVDCIQWIKEKLNIINLKTWKSPYHFPSPKEWNSERFTFPISFAPNISYKGVEDLRFLPHWADKNDEDYWTYCFLWWLDGKISFNSKILERDLKNYYSGLVKRNSENINPNKIFPVKVSVKPSDRNINDNETYNGTITMLDYKTQMPITLNIKIHVKNCNKFNNSALLFELSPKPFNHNIWTKMKIVNENFNCEK